MQEVRAGGSSVYTARANMQRNMPNIENQFVVGDNLFVDSGWK